MSPNNGWEKNKPDKWSYLSVMKPFHWARGNVLKDKIWWGMNTVIDVTAGLLWSVSNLGKRLWSPIGDLPKTIDKWAERALDWLITAGEKGRNVAIVALQKLFRLWRDGVQIVNRSWGALLDMMDPPSKKSTIDRWSVIPNSAVDWSWSIYLQDPPLSLASAPVDSTEDISHIRTSTASVLLQTLRQDMALCPPKPSLQGIDLFPVLDEGQIATIIDWEGLIPAERVNDVNRYYWLHGISQYVSYNNEQWAQVKTFPFSDDISFDQLTVGKMMQHIPQCLKSDFMAANNYLLGFAERTIRRIRFELNKYSPSDAYFNKMPSSRITDLRSCSQIFNGYYSQDCAEAQNLMIELEKYSQALGERSHGIRQQVDSIKESKIHLRDALGRFTTVEKLLTGENAKWTEEWAWKIIQFPWSTGMLGAKWKELTKTWTE